MNTPTDAIQIKGIQALGTHGVLAQEHTQAQPFIVDATLWLNLRQAGVSDQLEHTVNYAQIAERITDVITGPHVDLIERLAELITQAILAADARKRIERLAVTVHKPQAPLTTTFSDVSVTIERTRHDLEQHTVHSPHAVHHCIIALGGNSVPTAESGESQHKPTANCECERHNALIATFRSAVAAINALEQTQITGIAPLYITQPWGMPSGTPNFVNTVVEVSTALEPHTLLKKLQQIETSLGRTHTTPWASRTIDLDIISVDEQVSNDTQLTLPHPRAWQRAFVLAPWLDLDPHATLAGTHGGSVAAALQAAPDRNAVSKLSDDWIVESA